MLFTHLSISKAFIKIMKINQLNVQKENTVHIWFKVQFPVQLDIFKIKLVKLAVKDVHKGFYVTRKVKKWKSLAKQENIVIIMHLLLDWDK